MRIRLESVPVTDQDHALRFYTEKLGFVKRQDIPMGEGARFLTVVSPDEPDATELMLEPNGEHPATKMYKQALYAEGIPVTAFLVEDCQAEYERLKELRRVQGRARGCRDGHHCHLGRHLRQPDHDLRREGSRPHIGLGSSLPACPSGPKPQALWSASRAHRSTENDDPGPASVERLYGLSSDPQAGANCHVMNSPTSTRGCTGPGPTPQVSWSTKRRS